jgi:hypothetical protein
MIAWPKIWRRPHSLGPIDMATTFTLKGTMRALEVMRFYRVVTADVRRGLAQGSVAVAVAQYD